MVKLELGKLGIPYHSIHLGMIETAENVSDEQLQELKLNLAVSGLELLDD